MSVGEESESEIADLLKASDLAMSGAEIAHGVGDVKAAKRLREKSTDLYLKALAIDPAQNARAWSE